MQNTHYRSADGEWLLIGLTRAETREFESLDARPPLLPGGGIGWIFEGLPSCAPERRWLELYLKHRRALAAETK